MSRRFIQDPVTLEFHEVPAGARFKRAEPEAPAIWDDLPGYESPVTGLWIEGRKARREDLKRHRCRPYEGREQEAREAARQRAEHERRLDQLAEKMAYRAWDMAPERIRRIFRSR